MKTIVGSFILAVSTVTTKVQTLVKSGVCQLVGQTAKAADANASLDATKATAGFTNLTNYLIAGIEGVGGVFIVMGVVSLATAIKSGEQNPETLTGAGKNILIGLMFCAVGGVIAWFS